MELRFVCSSRITLINYVVKDIKVVIISIYPLPICNGFYVSRKIYVIQFYKNSVSKVAVNKKASNAIWKSQYVHVVCQSVHMSPTII